MIKKHALQYKTRLLPKQNELILRDRQVHHIIYIWGYYHMSLNDKEKK